MIVVTRLDGKEVVVNAGHLLLVESIPDTVLVLTTGHKVMVRESRDQVIEKVVRYRASIGGSSRTLRAAAHSGVPDGGAFEALPPTEESET